MNRRVLMASKKIPTNVGVFLLFKWEISIEIFKFAKRKTLQFMLPARHRLNNEKLPKL
jgi:hypothetical protein